ncbi:MAG: zf-TFIIB domain-containing protein [Polyangiaceae bacterium]|nr:zf-TFIIB domain-containing protein [Polyangiaceae bacterium]
MKCPKCVSSMETVMHGVHRCGTCRGLLLDPLARERLLETDGAESLDAGTDSVGKRWDVVDAVVCPRCNVRMVRLVDARGPDVHFEQCADCGSSFLDAGELRRLRRARSGGFWRRLLG